MKSTTSVCKCRAYTAPVGSKRREEEYVKPRSGIKLTYTLPSSVLVWHTHSTVADGRSCSLCSRLLGHARLHPWIRSAGDKPQLCYFDLLHSTVIQHVVQQIHNKSKQVEFGLIGSTSTTKSRVRISAWIVVRVRVGDKFSLWRVW